MVLGASGDLAKKKTVSRVKTTHSGLLLTCVTIVPRSIWPGKSTQWPRAFTTNPRPDSTEINSYQRISRSLGMPEQRWTMRNTSSGSNPTSRRLQRTWSNNWQTSAPSAHTCRDSMIRMSRLLSYGSTLRNLRKDERSPTVFSTWPCHQASSPLFLSI